MKLKKFALSCGVLVRMVVPVVAAVAAPKGKRVLVQYRAAVNGQS